MSVLESPEWTLNAACRDAVRPDLWFSDVPKDQRAAVLVCAECPVKALCLAEAMDTGEVWGIRGGVQMRAVRTRKWDRRIS